MSSRLRMKATCWFDLLGLCVLLDDWLALVFGVLISVVLRGLEIRLRMGTGVVLIYPLPLESKSSPALMLQFPHMSFCIAAALVTSKLIRQYHQAGIEEFLHAPLRY
jgi:hypothetical protein